MSDSADLDKTARLLRSNNSIPGGKTLLHSPSSSSKETSSENEKNTTIIQDPTKSESIETTVKAKQGAIPKQGAKRPKHAEIKKSPEKDVKVIEQVQQMFATFELAIKDTIYVNAEQIRKSIQSDYLRVESEI